MGNPAQSFTRLQRVACKASVMIEGLTGRGKSGLALMIAYALVGGFQENKPADVDPWEKIFTVDTENRSLNLFVGIPGSWGKAFGQPYGTQLDSTIGFAPSHYLEIRDAAIKAGAEVFIADSITHMWTAKGGVLDRVNEMKNRNTGLDNYRVWGSPEVSDEKQKLVDVIRCDNCHVITTVRVKEKFDMQYNADKQKNEVISIGEQQLQQEGLKFEPDLVLHMLKAGTSNGKHPVAKVIKSRYAILNQDEEYEFTPELCEQIRVYLAEGVDPAELLEKQRMDYVVAVKLVLDTNSSARAIWGVLKEDAGHKDTKLNDMPLDILKRLYTQITAE